jgi:hypothetical protein
MILRRPRADSAPILDPGTMVCCVQAFRPQAVSRMVERGDWLRLDNPNVQAWPQRFAVRLTDLSDQGHEEDAAA